METEELTRRESTESPSQPPHAAHEHATRETKTPEEFFSLVERNAPNSTLTFFDVFKDSTPELREAYASNLEDRLQKYRALFDEVQHGAKDNAERTRAVNARGVALTVRYIQSRIPEITSFLRERAGVPTIDDQVVYAQLRQIQTVLSDMTKSRREMQRFLDEWGMHDSVANYMQREREPEPTVESVFGTAAVVPVPEVVEGGMSIAEANSAAGIPETVPVEHVPAPEVTGELPLPEVAEALAELNAEGKETLPVGEASEVQVEDATPAPEPIPAPEVEELPVVDVAPAPAIADTAAETPVDVGAMGAVIPAEDTHEVAASVAGDEVYRRVMNTVPGDDATGAAQVPPLDVRGDTVSTEGAHGTEEGVVRTPDNTASESSSAETVETSVALKPEDSAPSAVASPEVAKAAPVDVVRDVRAEETISTPVPNPTAEREPVSVPAEKITHVDISLDELTKNIEHMRESGEYRESLRRWREMRTQYEHTEREYREGLRAYIAEQEAKNPLKRIAYSTRKLFGLNPQLPKELELKKHDATASAMMYGEALQAMVDLRAGSALARHPGDAARIGQRVDRYKRIFVQKAIIDRVRAHHDTVVGEQSSLFDRPELQKARALLQKTKWPRAAALVGIAALGATTGGVGAVLAAGSLAGARVIGGMAAGAGAYAGVKKLFDKYVVESRAKQNQYRENVARSSYFPRDYEALFSEVEEDFEGIRHAQRLSTMTAATAGVLAGGLYTLTADAIASPSVTESTETPPLQSPEETVTPLGNPLQSPDVGMPADTSTAPNAPSERAVYVFDTPVAAAVSAVPAASAEVVSPMGSATPEGTRLIPTEDVARTGAASGATAAVNAPYASTRVGWGQVPHPTDMPRIVVGGNPSTNIPDGYAVPREQSTFSAPRSVPGESVPYTPPKFPGENIPFTPPSAIPSTEVNVPENVVRGSDGTPWQTGSGGFVTAGEVPATPAPEVTPSIPVSAVEMPATPVAETMPVKPQSNLEVQTLPGMEAPGTTRSPSELVAGIDQATTPADSNPDVYSYPADPIQARVAELVKRVETYEVVKPGFLGLFPVTETLSTDGAVFARIQDMSLGNIARLIDDPSYRAEVFPQGVSADVLTRWANFIQQANSQTPAYVNLTLRDFMTSVAQRAE